MDLPLKSLLKRMKVWSMLWLLESKEKASFLVEKMEKSSFGNITEEKLPKSILSTSMFLKLKVFCLKLTLSATPRLETSWLEPEVEK